MKKVLVISIIVLAFGGILTLSYKLIKNENKGKASAENVVVEENIIEHNQEKVDKEKDNVVETEKIKKLKKELGFVGVEDLYFVGEEYDGRKVLSIKPEISFQVALAAILKQETPTYSKLTSLLENEPKGTGIWIEPNSQEKCMQIINQVVGDFYTINEEGYLINKEGEKKGNYYTKKIDQIIQGDKTYIIAFRSTCFVIDIVSGEITENFFEQMDPYQVYEYFQNEKKQLFIITTNQENKITSQEIIEAVLEKIMG